MRHFRHAVLVVAVAGLASCSVALDVLLYNNTATDVVVWKVVDKSSVQAAPGATVEFELRELQHIDFGQIAYEYAPTDLHTADYVFDRRIKLQAERDGKLYVVPASAQFPVSPLPAQPPGFPLTPVKRTDLT